MTRPVAHRPTCLLYIRPAKPPTPSSLYTRHKHRPVAHCAIPLGQRTAPSPTQRVQDRHASAGIGRANDKASRHAQPRGRLFSNQITGESWTLGGSPEQRRSRPVAIAHVGRSVGQSGRRLSQSNKRQAIVLAERHCDTFSDRSCHPLSPKSPSSHCIASSSYS